MTEELSINLIDKKSTDKLSPIEAINEFYRLKDKYENNYYEEYIKPILKRKIPKKEKRVEFSKLPKNKCINCERAVGTIFNIKYNDDDDIRIFTIKCGDLSDPCPLDIQVNYSKREQFSSFISGGLKTIEDIKLNIIKEKNNVIFFEKQQSIIKNFEKLTEDLKLNTELTGAAIETDILKNDNPAKHQLLSKSVDEFGQSFIIPFKQMIKNYMEKNDELILNQAMDFYVDEMMPKLKEIENLKYEVNFVEYDLDSKQYILIQHANSLENKEYYYDNDDKVVKFVKGLRKVTNKPKKVKPTIELVEEELVEEVENAEQNEEQNEEPNEEENESSNNNAGSEGKGISVNNIMDSISEAASLPIKFLFE